MLGTVITIAAYAYVVAVAVVLVWEDRDPTTTLAWLLILIFLPIVGIPLYVLFGRNWRVRGSAGHVTHDTAAASARVMAPVRAANEDVARRLAACVRTSDIGKVVRSVEEQCDTVPLPADGMRIVTSGAEKFRLLIEDISAAERFVHLQYYIWECDELTGRVVDALIERLAAGVEVRLSYDLIGSMRYGKSQLRRLAAAGGQVRPEVTDPLKLNYRNHRKIVVIDGRIGYTGGFNVGQEYVDGGPRFESWRDSHLRIEGPFVAELHALFCADWKRVAGESLFSERYFPVIASRGGPGAVLAQMEHSSVESEWEAIRETFILAITNANERVWVSSPYFVPDAGLYDALIATALSGVDVRLVMTGVPDKRVAWWAAMSYYERFLRAGGRVYQYTAGFYHPKAMSIDSTFCTIGTANLDTRSLQLHREMTVWIYDEESAREQDRLFEEDIARSREVTLADVGGWSAPRRFRNSLMRLGAKLL